MDNKAKILDIAMNLTRIGNWAADDYKSKKKRIIIFLDQTSEYLISLEKSDLSDRFKKTLDRFLAEYPVLEKEGKELSSDVLAWAERMMTWGNILTHRSKLVEP